MRSIRHLANLLAATLLMGASIASALPSGRVAVEATGFGAEGDQMGAAVAVLGGTAIVGSPNATPGSIASAGAVQIFRDGAEGWEREALLQGSTAGSGFGGEVTIGPDVVAIGTSGVVGNTFVYRRSGTTWARSDVFDYGNHPSISGSTLAISNANGVRVWTDEAGTWTVQADFGGDLAGQGEFVLAVNVSGDTLAFLTYVFTGSTGAAVNGYFYTRSGDTWARDAKIEFGVIPKSLFQSGTAIRLSGDTALISLAGAASVRVRGDGSWPQQAELADISFPLVPTSVAIEGDRVVVGSGGDDVLGVREQGSAYVFERSGSTWTRVSHPYDANGGMFQYFGASVALSGDTLFVGSTGGVVDGVPTGKATPIVLGAGTWAAGTSVDEGNRHAGESLALTLGASGSTLVLGAPGANVSTPGRSGVVRIFDAIGSSWVETAHFAPASQQFYNFPAAVAIDGDTFVAGSNNDNDGNPDEYGAVYVYRRTGGDWTIEQRISSGGMRPDFGNGVALEGDVLIVADPGRSSLPDPANHIRTFMRSGASWTEGPEVLPNPSEDALGSSLALSENTLAVGTPGANVEIEEGVGAVSVFENVGGTWQQNARLLCPSPIALTGFGSTVAVEGDTLAAGVARASDGIGAYIYVRDGDAWTLQAALQTPSIPDQAATSVALSADGATAIVGVSSPADQEGGTAYFFQRDGDTWTLVRTTHGDAWPRPDAYGAAVAITGSDAIIGAPADPPGGAAYVVSFGDPIYHDGFE